MNTQHTPTPFDVGFKDGYEQGDNFYKPSMVWDYPGASESYAAGLKDGLKARRAVYCQEELLDALYMALPYVETALEDQGYKPGAVERRVKQLKDAIAKAEGK